LGAHFGHGASPVNLDGLFEGPELIGDLFIQHTGDDQREHFIFAMKIEEGRQAMGEEMIVSLVAADIKAHK